MVKISLFLDRSDHKYSPGDVINLEIRVQVTSNTKFRSIYARIHGYAHVEFTEIEHRRRSRRGGRSYESYTERINYCSHETFIKNYQTLAGARAGSEILPYGSHVYHASFLLPRNLPENHENNYGHIRYEAKVHINVPWGFDKKERVTFYVNPRLDLNDFPNLREPIRVVAVKTFGCCCWESSPLQIYNVLPRSGYVPGDRVQYSLEFNNASDVSINRATVELVEKTEYHADAVQTNFNTYHTYHHYHHSNYYRRSSKRETSRTLWRHEFSTNDRHLVATMQNKILSTALHFDPSCNFRFFNGCGIITVRYYLVSEARTSGCHTNLTNCNSIYMGTIPFRSYEDTLPSMMPFSSAPARPISQQPLPSYSYYTPQTYVSYTSTSRAWTETNNSITHNSKTPPPTFTEVELMAKTEK